MNKKTLDYFSVEGSGKYDFLGKAKYFVLLSGFAVVFSLVYIGTKGLNYGIDFKGGTEVQVLFKNKVETDQIRTVLDGLKIPDPEIQKFGENNEFLIRFENPTKATAKETNEYLLETVKSLTEGLQSQLTSFGPEVRRVDTVGPQVGSQLKKNSMLAVFYSLLVILIYVALRFDYIFAPGTVICLFHDAIVTMGALAVLHKEMNVQILAAILTIIGYSLNDTIIVFDRVRETMHHYHDKHLPWIINRAVNETLSRTIMTSASTFIAVFCLYVFTEGVIKDFALAMCMGIVYGTYSTVYIASPCVILFDRLNHRKSLATQKVTA